MPKFYLKTDDQDSVIRWLRKNIGAQRFHLHTGICGGQGWTAERRFKGVKVWLDDPKHATMLILKSK
jgi:hypothetical protein